MLLFMYIEEGSGTPLHYSCLENPMDGGAWWAVVHGVAESWTRLSDFTFTINAFKLLTLNGLVFANGAWVAEGRTGSLGLADANYYI